MFPRGSPPARSGIRRVCQTGSRMALGMKPASAGVSVSHQRPADIIAVHFGGYPADVIALREDRWTELGECKWGSPTSLAFTRKALYQGLDGTLETAMAFEGFALEKCYVSPEHKEYVAAFLEKRKPNFKKAKG